jgi:hypothetical protein
MAKKSKPGLFMTVFPQQFARVLGMLADGSWAGSDDAWVQWACRRVLEDDFIPDHETFTHWNLSQERNIGSEIAGRAIDRLLRTGDIVKNEDGSFGFPADDEQHA